MRLCQDYPLAVLVYAVTGESIQRCTWRGLPRKYGRWHTVYTRMSRWAKAGVLDRVFEELQPLNIRRLKIEMVSIDGTSSKVHPDGTGALKTGVLKLSAAAATGSRPSFIWLPRASSRSSASH